MEAKETDMQIKEKDLLILDSYFLNNSYIDKFSPSKADLYLHKLINSNVIEKFSNLKRWYHHISSVIENQGILTDNEGAPIHVITDIGKVCIRINIFVTFILFLIFSFVFFFFPVYWFCVKAKV